MARAFRSMPTFLHERKEAQREVFRQIPINRLLIETDAPDMLPPENRNRHPLSDDGGAPVNHPANIDLAYDALAEIRGAMPVEWKLHGGQMEENF